MASIPLEGTVGHPYLYQKRPVQFNENLDWQFNKRRTEIYLEKQQQYL